MTVELEGKKINYAHAGTGPCIVFLHGFLENLTIWDDFVAELVDDHKVIQVDLPGHGKTELFGSVHSMTLMASAVHTVLRHEGVQECVIVGHSMGGYVALEFCKTFGHMVKGLCLFNSSALPDTPEKKAERTQVAKILKRGYNHFVEEAIPHLFTAKNQEKLKDLIAELVREAKEIPVEGAIAATLGMRDRADSVAFLKTVKFPVLFVIGRQDPIIPFDKYKEQIFVNELINVYVSAHSGHMGFIEDRDGTFDSVKNFIDYAYE
ncbi:MAG TPA: alpha/beta fold hydrolase [Flavobacteriales bacterium]|nr:alpha/beta fold hydrolase [Flavobacteriales bacterium]